MSLGGLAIPCFLVCIYCLIKGKDYFINSIIVFAPFCASCVFVFSSFFLQPGHFFLFAYFGVIIVLSLYRREPLKIKKVNPLLTAFVLFALLTILIAALLRTDVMVYGIGNNNKLKSSLVSFQNITQYLYLFLGFCTYCIVYNYCICSYVNKEKVIRLMSYSGIIILIIGMYQVMANLYGLPYDEIFRNSVKEMWQTKLRVQATFGEASFFGQFCVYLFPIIVLGDWTKKKIYRITAILLLIVMGVLSRSTGFLLGISGVMLSMFVFTAKRRKILLRWITIILVGVIAIPLVFSKTLYFQEIVDLAIAKLTLESWSGVERNMIFNHMLNVGIHNPLFGIGYGGGRSTDLYANLLANTGVIGFALFFGFVARDVNILLTNINRDFKNNVMCLLLVIGFLITSCSVPDLSYLPIWVIFAVIDVQCRYLVVNQRNRIDASNVAR